jgi:hypothetical protein
MPTPISDVATLHFTNYLSLLTYTDYLSLLTHLAAIAESGLVAIAIVAQHGVVARSAAMLAGFRGRREDGRTVEVRSAISP